MGNCKKLISTCSSHKLLCRHGSPQADGKSTDIGITGFMTSAVINTPEIIKIKTADTGICIRFCLTQQFFTFIFVRKSCRMYSVSPVPATISPRTSKRCTQSCQLRWMVTLILLAIFS